MTTSSRSDLFARARRCELTRRSSIGLLLLFQFLNDLVELAVACVPELVIPLDPCRHFLETAGADSAGPDAADLLGDDESRLFEDADVLPHAGEGHVEPVGEVRDRGVLTAELLENTASRGVRQRRKRGIEMGPRILNHTVQCMARRPGRQGPPAGGHFIDDVGREPLLGLGDGQPLRRADRPVPRRVAQMTDAGSGLISLWKRKEATGE